MWSNAHAHRAAGNDFDFILDVARRLSQLAPPIFWLEREPLSSSKRTTEETACGEIRVVAGSTVVRSNGSIFETIADEFRRCQPRAGT